MEWIDVINEKPKLGIGVLVYLKKGFITVAYRKQELGDFFWQLFGDTEFLVDENDEVTHWMPLPNKPSVGNLVKLNKPDVSGSFLCAYGKLNRCEKQCFTCSEDEKCDKRHTNNLR